MWPYLFNRICWCLVVMQLFTFCVFLVKQAYVQVKLWCRSAPFTADSCRGRRTLHPCALYGVPLPGRPARQNAEPGGHVSKGERARLGVCSWLHFTAPPPPPLSCRLSCWWCSCRC